MVGIYFIYNQKHLKAITVNKYDYNYIELFNQKEYTLSFQTKCSLNLRSVWFNYEENRIPTLHIFVK